MAAGPGARRQWAFTVSQFRALLNDAGYTVKIVSPVDLPAALDSPNILLAVPSLESLPFEAFTAIVAHTNAGGSLMASGGEPFRNPLYRTPDGRWLDSAAYLQRNRIASAAGTLHSPADTHDISRQRAVHCRYRRPCADPA